MEARKIKKEYIYNIIFILAMTGLTAMLIFRGEDKGSIIKLVMSIKPIYLATGIILALGFIIGEAISIKLLLRIFNYDYKLINTLKYAFTGFVFSSITPSSTGGQPMQIYEMKKDGIEIYQSSLILLLELMVYQVVTVIYGIVAFVWARKISLVDNKLAYTLILIGIVLNIVSAILINICIFNPKISLKLYRITEIIIKKLPMKPDSKDKFLKSLKYQIEEYNQCSKYIKENIYLLFKVLIVTIVQVGAFFSVSYVVYIALGNTERTFIEILLIQTLAYVSSSYIPLPGAIGISESNFLSIYKKIYSANLLTGALIINRGITFYLLLGISMVALLFYKATRCKMEA